MKKLRNILSIGLIALAFNSCEDDAALTTMEVVNFPAPVVATPENIVLSEANKFESVVTVSWDHVMFPIAAPVTYTLAIDATANTFGENGWANAIRIPVGADVLSTSILGGDLNDYAHQLGLVPDEAGQLMMRVEAYMDRRVYSEAVAITVTPFTEEIAFGEIYMPGSYNGWDPSTASKLSAISTGVYQGYVTVTSPMGLGFKFTPEQDWDAFYGLDDNGNLALGADGDLSLPGFGSFQLTVNLNTLTYTIVPYSWGIIGPATTGGWTTDTDMSYDSVLSKWKYVGALMPGAMKFRLNDQWTVNYGTEEGNSGSITDALMFYDNPGAHTILEGGTYEVLFSVDPNNPATATYSVQLQ